MDVDETASDPHSDTSTVYSEASKCESETASKSKECDIEVSDDAYKRNCGRRGM